MNNFPLIGLGIATKGTSGNILDAFYPCISFKNGEDEISLMYEKWDALLSEDVTEIKDVAQLDLQDKSLKTAIVGPLTFHVGLAAAENSGSERHGSGAVISIITRDGIRFVGGY